MGIRRLQIAKKNMNLKIRHLKSKKGSPLIIRSVENAKRRCSTQLKQMQKINKNKK